MSEAPAKSRVAVKHGLYLAQAPDRRRAYVAWFNMLQRTGNPRHPEYRNYGDRGISVCEEWKTFAGFHASIGDIPPGMSIERKDVNSGYSPQNCTLIPFGQQQQNRRDTILITYDGRTQCLAHWARELGIRVNRLRKYVVNRGLSLEEALAIIGGRASWLRPLPKPRRAKPKIFGPHRKPGRKPKQGPPRPPRNPWREELITFGGITLTREEWAESLGADLSKYEAPE